MKLLTRFTIGLGGGTLLALLYQTTASDRPLRAPADAFSDLAISGPAPLREGVDVQTSSASRAAADGLAAEYAASFASFADWAFFDPAGFFTHAEGADSIDELIAGLEVLIATDPGRVMEIAARFQGKGSSDIDALYLHAIKGMVGRDPYGAIVRLQGVAAGPQRDPILAAIGEAYASIDADAALRWAASVLPPAPDALDKVLETVAATDLLRAYDLMQQVPGRIANAELLGSAMARAALAGEQAPASIASALARRREPDADIILRGLMQGWMLQQPESVVEWMNANEAYLTDELTRAAVYYLAFEDVTYAAALTDSVPASAQSQWLSEVANRYGQFDIDAALKWLQQYQGRTGYTEILNRTLLGSATLSRTTPQAVADFIASTDADISYESVMRTGYSYADHEPEAAMQWALGLRNPEYAGWAAAAAIDGWGANDAPAAQRFALAQPRGALRDQMLSALLQGGVFYEGLDRKALVRGHTSPAAAQESIHMFILRDVINRREVTAESKAEVEWMLDQLTDVELKREAEERIAEYW